jgi:hypothetical protein
MGEGDIPRLQKYMTRNSFDQSVKAKKQTYNQKQVFIILQSPKQNIRLERGKMTAIMDETSRERWKSRKISTIID